MKITDEMKEMTQLLSEYDVRSNCYYIGNYALLYEDLCHETIGLNVTLLEEMKNKGVNAMGILDYSFDPASEPLRIGSITTQSGWLLQERAKGKPIHTESEFINIDPTCNSLDVMTEYYEALRRYSSEIAILANASQEQFDAFVKDYYALTESPLAIDQNINKIYYDEEKGFSFVGLKVNGKKPIRDTMTIIKILNLLIYQPPILVAKYKDYSTVIDDIPNEIYAGLTKNIKIILDKTISSLRKVPVRKTFIDNDIDHYCDMKSNLIVGGISQDNLKAKIDNVFLTMKDVYENSVKYNK